MSAAAASAPLLAPGEAAPARRASTLAVCSRFAEAVQLPQLSRVPCRGAGDSLEVLVRDNGGITRSGLAVACFTGKRRMPVASPPSHRYNADSVRAT